VSDALRAEWTKLRTLATTTWLLAGTVALTVAVSGAVTGSIRTSGSDGGQDPTKLSLTGIYLGQAVIAALAVLAISDEYNTGMIRTTLAAMPRRTVVLLAKATNVAGLAVVAGILAVAGCLTAGRLLLPSGGLNPAHGYPLVSIAHATTLRAGLGSVAYLTLIALLSLGVATAVRDTAVSIGVVLGLLYLPLLLAQAVSDPLRRHIEQIAPMTAGIAIQTTTNLRALPIKPWTGLGVLAAWAAAWLLIGGLLIRLRDA
jgi:ABC-2 type transport system permease protein